MKALLAVDIQNDFCPGGTLAVKQGDQLIPIINTLREKFSLTVFTQDWHPSDHLSFVTQHPGKHAGDIIELDGLTQVLWPAHCVQNTIGAAFYRGLIVDKGDPVFRKGTDRNLDSYSAFFDNQHKKDTGLSDFLKKKGVKSLYVCGLATDYCVKYTALDALTEGFEVFVIPDACKAVNLKSSDGKIALEEMQRNGAILVESTKVIASKLL